MSQVQVVIVAWNSGEHLQHAVDGLAAQSFRDFELLVWDNASEDGAVDALRLPEGARLVRCRATKLAFLDFPGRELTLPVAAEQTRTLRVDPYQEPDADPEGRPTPGMGLSLGIALPA